MVNITPKAKKIAEEHGFYIVFDTNTLVLPNGVEVERDCVTIGEDDTDFLIQYGIGADGVLYLITKPDYVEDLPAHIKTGVELRKVVEFAVTVN